MDQVSSDIAFQEQFLWFNSLIRIDNKPIFFKEWFEIGISKVKHLQSGNDNFLTLKDFASKHDLRVRPLSFFGLLSAVKQIRKNVTDTAETRDYTFETLSEKIVKREKPGPLIYQKLIRAKSLTPRKSQLKWFQDCNFSDEEDTFNWELAYLMARRCTKSTKLIEFQFKLLHRRIPTNDFLFKIGRKENDNCTFCNYSSETLIHLFLVLPCYIFFLEKRNRLASKRSSVNRQIQLIEHYCTGLEAGASFYRILVSIKLLSPVSAVSYLASQNG